MLTSLKHETSWTWIPIAFLYFSVTVTSFTLLFSHGERVYEVSPLVRSFVVILLVSLVAVNIDSFGVGRYLFEKHYRGKPHDTAAYLTNRKLVPRLVVFGIGVGVALVGTTVLSIVMGF